MEVLIAAVAAALYGLVSLVIGNRFPFSKHAMYATTANRKGRGAVPLLWADHQVASIDRFDRIAGLDPDTLYPKGMPCSLEWQIHEAARWIRNHRAAPDSPPGPVKVVWGFVVVHVQDDGTLTEEVVELQSGTAWPR